MDLDELSQFVLKHLDSDGPERTEARTMLYVLAQRLRVDDATRGISDVEAGEEILKLLALPCASKPGYDPAWRPYP